MKRSFYLLRARANSFTLVELLVVMGIIAILAGVLFGVGNIAIQTAKRTKALNTAQQIQISVLNYYSEYSVYPYAAATAPTQDTVITDSDATTWKGMLYGLCGNINPYTGQTNAPSGSYASNARAIPFLNIKKSDVDSNGGPLNPSTSSATSLYFNMAIDYDYDNILGVSPSNVTSMPNFGTTFSATGGGTSTAGVAVWANGNPNASSTNANFYIHTY